MVGFTETHIYKCSRKTNRLKPQHRPKHRQNDHNSQGNIKSFWQARNANKRAIFQSIQGEGSRVGLECTFIRTVGCNLACDFCDTDFFWERIQTSGFFSTKAKWIWLTGGEPLLQPDVKEVVEKLQSNGHKSRRRNKRHYALCPVQV